MNDGLLKARPAFGRVLNSSAKTCAVVGPAQIEAGKIPHLNKPLALGGFALIERFGLLVKADCETGRFDKRPGQVLLAVFDVAAAFAFALAAHLAGDTAAIRSKLADLLKALDPAVFQHAR